MASFEHTVSRNLQCPICFDLLSDPKQLSCTHTFCKKCLGDILTSQNQANAVPCPICRSTTDIKDGKVENLNTNVPLKSLVDDIRNCKQLCEMCDMQSRAVHFCCACSKYICNECLELHNNHEVVRVADIREGRVVLEEVYCKEKIHKADGLKEISNDVCIKPCKKFICFRCRTLYHKAEKGHMVQSAGEYEASIKEEIESLQARGKTKLATVKNHMKYVDDQLKRVSDHSNREKARNNREYEEAIEKLKEIKATRNQGIDAQKERSCQRLKQMKVEDEILAASIESASELVGHSLKAPLAGDIIAIRDSLSSKLKDVLDRDDPKKNFSADVAYHAEELKFMVGHRSESPSTWSICRPVFVFGFWYVFFIALLLFWFRSLPDLKCRVELLQKGSMNSMTVSPDGDMMAVGYGTGGIAFYSADGQLHSAVLEDVGIRGVGFLSDGRCVVLNTLNTIMLYTLTWEQLDVRFESLSNEEGGFGSLTVDSDDHIYVSYRKAKKIQVFSPAGGKAIREIPCDGYEPMQIASYGNVSIVKQDSNAVIIIDDKGNIKHELTKPIGTHLHASVSNSNSVLIASIRHEEGLLSIDEYTTELEYMKNLIYEFKIEKPERNWYYLQQFESGEIAFCTPDRLYYIRPVPIPCMGQVYLVYD